MHNTLIRVFGVSGSRTAARKLMCDQVGHDLDTEMLDVETKANPGVHSPDLVHITVERCKRCRDADLRIEMGDLDNPFDLSIIARRAK